MELPSKILEQIAFNTRPKIEEHMMVVMDKSTQEQHLYQPLLTNCQKFKIAVTFLTGNNGIFNLTLKNIEFYFMKSNTDEGGFIQITIPPGAYEIEELDKKKVVIGEQYYTNDTYPFKIQPNVSALG